MDFLNMYRVKTTGFISSTSFSSFSTSSSSSLLSNVGRLRSSGLLLLIFILPVLSQNGEKMEYCQFETFSAECPKGQVIMMKHAKYGRMRLGRCVVADLGYVGCTTDVLHLADRRCSGRRTCKISIPDEGFDRMSTCLTELKSYLEASYECVKVTSTSKGVCSACNYGIKLSAENGRIASVVAEETGCGTPDCPWIIEAKPGQKVNISLTDFALARRDGTRIDQSSRASGSCRVYATIKEESVSRSFTVCGGQGRQRHLYTSVTNTVEIRIVGQPSTTDGRDHFLLTYEAIGCADPHQPANGWYKRKGTKAFLGCNDTGDRWEIVCKDGRWVGKTGNCSSGNGGIFAHSVLGTGNMPSGLSVVVILAVAVTIGLVIFIIGLIVLKRQGRPRRPPTAQQIQSRDTEGQYMKSGYDPRGHPHETDKDMLHGGGKDKNEYAHIWEMPLPQPRNDSESNNGTMSRTGASGSYGYRSNTLPAYPVVPLSHDQSYGNNTLARTDYTEHIEREEDPRYYQLDPDLDDCSH